MTWETIGRPGHFGKKRDEILAGYDIEHGKDNWRIVWKWGEKENILLPWIEACYIYEDSYFADSFVREGLWRELQKDAKDVFDHEESDVESGLDYKVQNSNATHMQDISIRRVFNRRGWAFEGDELIQIRSHSEPWGYNLSPGKVPFHRPELIVKPQLESWWNPDSVESWYQCAKVLQKRVLD